MAYFLLVVILVTAIASVGAYVAQTANVSHRRRDMVSAIQFAQGGAVVACVDLNKAYTNATGFPGNLTTNAVGAYTFDASLSTTQYKVYKRTISALFTNQPVSEQIWVTNSVQPETAKIISTTTVGSVTQHATLNLSLQFGPGAAIVSLNQGVGNNGVSKVQATRGNVVLAGNGHGQIYVDAGTGQAILANGNLANAAATINPINSVAATQWGTANQVADYTAQGTTNSLFDINRFIAVADLTPNSYNTNTHNNHFTNVMAFSLAMAAAPTHTLEGVVVVDINLTDPNWSKAGDVSLFPAGINLRGMLLVNVGPGFGAFTTFPLNAALNINPANLTGMAASDPKTYSTGFPPVYSDPTKDPTLINISSKGFANFTSNDQLPALAYSSGAMEIFGPANISGVVFTPGFMDIENSTTDGTTQYFRGSLIMGHGLFVSVKSYSNTIISFDRHAAALLPTWNNVGKVVKVAYWE
jgi:hypothetical protein